MLKDKMFPIMEYGFKDFAGNIWWDSLVDLYNKITCEMERGCILGSPLYEQLADSRHKLFFIAGQAK